MPGDSGMSTEYLGKPCYFVVEHTCMYGRLANIIIDRQQEANANTEGTVPIQCTCIHLCQLIQAKIQLITLLGLCLVETFQRTATICTPYERRSTCIPVLYLRHHEPQNVTHSIMPLENL